MIGLAVRLRLALLRGALRSGPGSSGRRTAFFAGAAVALLLGFSLGLLLCGLRGQRVAPDVAVVLLTSLVVGWTVVPVLTFAGDDLLDASKLSLLPLSPRDVLVLHGVGAFVGPGPVATLLVLGGLAVATAHGTAGWLLALVVVPLALALCVVTSRTVAALLSRLLRSRRGRDLGVALTALVAVSAQVANPLLSRVAGQEGAEQGLHRVAQVLGVLPPGLLASAPSTASDGRVLLALGKVLVVLAVLAALLLTWERALRRAAETVDGTTSAARPRRPLVPPLLELLAGPGRVGAVAAKDLRYLVREPRRLVQLVTSTLLPAVLVAGPALSSAQGLSAGTVFGVCGIAAFAGQSGSNRFGVDGTATWALVASGGDRRAARRDLLGGDLATVLVTLPLLLLAGTVLAALSDGWRYWVPAEGLAVGVLAVTVGTAGLAAVFAPFPVPDTRSNAFGGGSGGQGLLAVGLVLATMAASVVVLLPLLVLLLPALHGGNGVPLALTAPLYGGLVGAGARELAARSWARRGPEVLLALSAQR